MKEHAIIPIFIPHKGCPNDCVFCNQHAITARTEDVSVEDVRRTIDTWLTTLEEVPTVEVAFYGGSFTGIPVEEQRQYLEVAHEYLACGKIDAIHLSTRPDYISREILDLLREYEVQTIELGVQSFDDEVLRRSNRGHTAEDVYRAVELIHEYGFELGIQLMIGLPGDSMESCVFSAEETVRLHPSLARLYPTIVLNDTELYRQYERGEYEPLTLDEAVARTKRMYQILNRAGITILRVGLKSTDIITDGGMVNGETYHPAFRQLVEGEIMKEGIRLGLDTILSDFDLPELPGEEFSRDNTSSEKIFMRSQLKVDIFSNEVWYSNLVGHRGCNKKYFTENYPEFNLKFKVDSSLENGRYRIEIKEE